jgi:predicted phosphate transport protein (TIGR00153 family)
MLAGGSMLKRFMPRETNFFDYFERHAATTVRGCRELVDLATAGTDFVARAARIKDIEHEADSITHDCVEALHKTFITPIDRDQIHMLISHMDDIMDYVEVVSDLCVLYNIDGMTQDARDLADVLLDATLHIEGAVKGLRDMKHAEAISEACIEVNRLENKGDELLRRAVARLFNEEKDPVAIIKWKELYENLEIATDRCEDVANIIEGIVLENA